MAEFESLDGGRLVSEVLRLLREGPGAGLRAVVTGDRTALSSRFSSLCERIVLLRLNDRATYGMAGLNPRRLPERIGPGRGFAARSGLEMQIAPLDADPLGPAQQGVVEGLAAQVRERAVGVPEALLPEPMRPPPALVSASSLLHPAFEVQAGPGRRMLLGVGGDRVDPVVVDLDRVGPGSPADGELFGVRLSRTTLFSKPPGRALLLAQGEMTPLQMPLDDLGAQGPAADLPMRYRPERLANQGGRS